MPGPVCQEIPDGSEQETGKYRGRYQEGQSRGPERVIQTIPVVIRRACCSSSDSLRQCLEIR